MKLIGNFFSKRRTGAMLIGAVLGVAFGLLAWMIRDSEFFSGLFLNIASAALEIPLIAALLDYWWEISREAKAKKARVLVMSILGNIDHTLTTMAALIFGFKYKPRHEDLRNFESIMKNYKTRAWKYLEGVDLDNFNLRTDKAVADIYLNELEGVSLKLQSCLIEFGFALEEDIKGEILELRHNIVRALTFKPTLQYYDEEAESSIRKIQIRTSAVHVRSSLRGLHKYIEN